MSVSLQAEAAAGGGTVATSIGEAEMGFGVLRGVEVSFGEAMGRSLGGGDGSGGGLLGEGRRGKERHAVEVEREGCETVRGGGGGARCEVSHKEICSYILLNNDACRRCIFLMRAFVN